MSAPVAAELISEAGSVNGREVPRRRLLGAYYTPDHVAEILVRWALDGVPGRLLDPSFGGCAFLEAAARVLDELGAPSPGALVHGVDVDPSCVSFVHSSALLVEGNITVEDYLTVSPTDFAGAPFRAVVGNPPYVRHHWVQHERREVARRIAKDNSVVLAETASLWAYFVVHALAFLEQDGRLALLVPESILQADYAEAVRTVLGESFRRVRLIHLKERLFEGTDEAVVVVAGEGYGHGGEVSVHSIDTVAELEGALRGVEVASPYTTLDNGRRVLPRALEAMDEVLASDRAMRFGSFATTRIGIVTGANTHFIRSAEALKRLGVPARARTGVVARTRWLSGMDFTEEDHRAVVAAGGKALLVRPTPAMDLHPGVLRWVEEGRQLGVHAHHKCAKREPWYRVTLPKEPHAFVTSTRLGPPVLVLNRTRYRCTNALYAVRFSLPEGVEPQSVALGFLTSFVALWAELRGRRYGGGVLKLDLGALSEIPLPVVEVEAASFADANQALRDGDEAGARRIADNVVLEEGLGISASSIETMREAYLDLMLQRIPTQKGA